MTIKDLLRNVDVTTVKNYENFEVESLACSTKEENPNGVYFCLQGSQVDGHDFYEQAVEQGAKCLVVERFLPTNVMQILVDNARKAMSQMSANFYELDNSRMKFVGITGTNGKTTTSFLVKSYLSKLGKRVGLIGTQGSYFDNMVLPTKLTTPDPIELYKLIHQMALAGIEYVVMEASAHAIALNKIDAINYDVVALTNITQDHLDYFKTMDNYARAKAKLFTPEHAKSAVVVTDDKYTQAIFDNTEIDKTSVSLYDEADVMLHGCELATRQTKAVINIGNGILPFTTNLVGKYNLSNSMLAVGILHQLGFSLEEIYGAISESNVKVPGRFNVLNVPADFSVVIDFAHTPDGLENVLKTIKELCKRRVICVFGCGGNRDSAKRPIMGEIAEKYADHVIVTSDNPRFENPSLIIKDITQNMHGNYEVEEDRVQAIVRALSIAGRGDIVAILGKGAENYQEIKGVKMAYSDYDVVDEYFKGVVEKPETKSDLA